jgi:L-iditol 2-dehydrogenase
VGLCGSDLHWFSEGGIGDAQLERPLVPGHELAGVIEGGQRHGQPVAIDPALPCNDCATCRRGDQNLCPDVAFAGHAGHDGGLREYIVWPSSDVYPLPPHLSADDGAMLEPLGVAVHAVDLGHLRMGATVAVIGAGPIGLLLLRAVRRAGATHVVVVEPLTHRRESALRLGADVALHRLVEQGLVNVSSMVTHRFPLAEVERAFAAVAAREGLKIVVEPGGR